MRFPAAAVLLIVAAHSLAGDANKPFRLPSLPDRMPVIIWGSECAAPDGTALKFGGESQVADDGRQRTQLKSANGTWEPLIEKLRAKNPAQQLHGQLWVLRSTVKDCLARARFLYFEGEPPEPEAFSQDVVMPLRKMIEALPKISGEIKDALAQKHVSAAQATLQSVTTRMIADVVAEDLKSLLQVQISLEQAAELLDAEPNARALSPLVYDETSRLFILFGGDHLDYLTNDTWVFDPTKQQWEQRHPKTAPGPRANHTLTAAEGRVTLSGGYTYSNNTDYMGGPYVNHGDGDWVYDVAANTWTPQGAGKSADDGTRTYRTINFHPNYFFDGKPDPAASKAQLDALPPNTWVQIKPPQMPKMQRDWGTAVIDPDHDVMLRFSGGHCAHGGSDVLMYHFSTNRWELPFPVELPLGQCYTNTSYPGGYNFNLRPWVTGHTYKCYAYDSRSRRMVFAGHQADTFLFDPTKGDWVNRLPKPSGLNHGGCFFDLLCKDTAHGVVCWTKEGRLFLYEAPASTPGVEAPGKWRELKVTGEKLPPSAVDSAGIDYDSKRDRLLLFPGAYGKPYNGQIIGVDMKTLQTASLNPAGGAGAALMPGFLRETCYIPDQDMLVSGVLLPPNKDGERWTPVYDCAANKWLSCHITGPNPAGKEGRNVSLGLVYDGKRKLIWAVDTHGTIYVVKVNLQRVTKEDL